MKKMRKGFTLIELLIVIAILGSLSAAMSVSITNSTALAKAKASTIARNVDACKLAAEMYYAEHMNDSTTLNAATTSTVLGDYIKAHEDFKKDTTNGATNLAITYTPDDTTAGPTGWKLTVDFSGDNDKTQIETELKNLPGYKGALYTNSSFTITLLTSEFKTE